jgi:hypothetical protein
LFPCCGEEYRAEKGKLGATSMGFFVHVVFLGYFIKFSEHD